LNPIPNDRKLTTLKRLARNETLNKFMDKTFNTSKRFGIEGCDSMISGLGALVDHSVLH